LKKRDESSYLEEGGRKLLPKKHQKSPPFFLFQPQIDVWTKNKTKEIKKKIFFLGSIFFKILE